VGSEMCIRDRLYLDTKLEFLQLEEVPNLKEETLQFLKKLIKLILKLDNISSPTEFVDVIDTWDGIVVEKLMSEEEWNCSNLAMIFYETLANFKALEDMKIVESWQRLYPQNRLSAGIINLFLQYLKNRRYKFLIEKNFTADIEITNLMDTRNMAAEELSFLNFIEGELPSARSVVWLFNERQRKQLGLKTWEDIRQWERYYLHRLLAHAKKVSFYTIEMQNEDVEASSFLYELYQFACTKTITYLQSWTKTDLPSDTLMKNWIYSYEEYPLLSESHSTKDINQETFFHLPYEDDFGSEKTIFLSWYACNRLLSDSIEYYILDYCKIKPRVVRMEETINNNLFGNIVHEFFSTIFNRLAEQRRGTLSMKWEWINNVFLENNLKSTLNKRIFEYQLPKNHNQIYFEKLLFPFLIKTASYFFHFCLEKETFLKKDFITIIPEEQYHKNRKLIYKKLISAEETKSKLSLYILGRADLRLETEKRKYIFDFKTGTGDAKQLWFYAFYYYLIDNPEMIDILNCAFYHILDFELDWKIREFQRKETLKQKLVDLLSELPQKGFEVGNKTTISYFDPILRIDLKHEIMEDSDLNGDKDE
ncbi:MAG: hypothetical protein N3A61_05205, partial [Ignavibacteria bacterium]|nr:hypothetical protein [Ignavibacteria bacterium]